MQGENALDANTGGYLPNRKGFRDTTMLAGNHQTLKNLDTLLLAFFQAHMHFHGIAGTEIRNIGLEILLCQLTHEVHCSCLQGSSRSSYGERIREYTWMKPIRQEAEEWSMLDS